MTPSQQAKALDCKSLQVVADYYGYNRTTLEKWARSKRIPLHRRFESLCTSYAACLTAPTSDDNYKTSTDAREGITARVDE